MAKKNTIMSKIYREFTRVRFQKYRLQFPRVRQSELITKIIKEWEAMDEEAKYNLENQYTERSGKGFLEDPSSSSKKAAEKQKDSGPMSSAARESAGKPITKKKKKPSPKVRVFIQKSPSLQKIVPTSKEDLANFQKPERENSKSPGKKSTPSKNPTSSSELAIQKAKEGKVPEVKKQSRNEEYNNFFKYYHDRLAGEHPRWSTPQISTIIRLLWKKRHIKNTKKTREIKGKVLSGRQLYSKTKLSEGLIKQQIKQLWKALPHESKKYWQIKGSGRPHRSDKDSGRFVRKVLNSGANKDAISRQTEPVLSWMNQQMK